MSVIDLFFDRLPTKQNTLSTHLTIDGRKLSMMIVMLKNLLCMRCWKESAEDGVITNVVNYVLTSCHKNIYTFNLSQDDAPSKGNLCFA